MKPAEQGEPGVVLHSTGGLIHTHRRHLHPGQTGAGCSTGQTAGNSLEPYCVLKLRDGAFLLLIHLVPADPARDLLYIRLARELIRLIADLKKLSG